MTIRYKILILTFALIVFLSTSAFIPLPQGNAQPIVRAVLFWMEGCPHCHEVINNVLPAIQQKYGDQFQIQIIELRSSQEVNTLYSLAESMGIPKSNVGVPFLIIGEHVLIGSGEIPEQLPGLIDRYLASGGVDFPDFPALAPLLELPALAEDGSPPSLETTQATQSSTGSAPIEVTPVPANPGNYPNPNPANETPTFQGESGFLFAWLTIFLLLASLAFSAVFVLQRITLLSLDIPPSKRGWVAWFMPVLAVLGLGVAAYLAYVETQSVRAFCGPIGDCNTVQSSSYARLFGILPVGVLGVIGYFMIIIAWIIQYFGKSPWSGLAALALFAMTFVGTLFSIYLTYLEVTVIKAVCMWCVSSALIMGGLLLLSLKPSPLPSPEGRGS